MDPDAQKKFEMTEDEARSFEKAFKDPEFLKLFADYAETLQDPKYREEYEEYIRQVESQGELPAGAKVMSPTPEFHIEGRIHSKTAQKKEDRDVFYVNICSSDLVDEPREERGNWRIPLSLSSVRGDVCDIVFHPDTTKRALMDHHFRKFIIDLTADYVLEKHKVSLDKTSIRVIEDPKSNGQPELQTIRVTPQEKKVQEVSSSSITSTAAASSGSAKKVAGRHRKEKKKTQKPSKGKAAKETSPPTAPAPLIRPASPPKPKTPTYEVVHVGEFDMSDYLSGSAPDVEPMKRVPKEFVIRVHLPLLRSAATLELETTRHGIELHDQKGNYELSILDLPCEVDDARGSAKFLKDERILAVTLPVVPPPLPKRKPEPIIQPTLEDDGDEGDAKTREEEEEEEEKEKEKEEEDDDEEEEEEPHQPLEEKSRDTVPTTSESLVQEHKATISLDVAVPKSTSSDEEAVGEEDLQSEREEKSALECGHDGISGVEIPKEVIDDPGVGDERQNDTTREEKEDEKKEEEVEDPIKETKSADGVRVRLPDVRQMQKTDLDGEKKSHKPGIRSRFTFRNTLMYEID